MDPTAILSSVLVLFFLGFNGDSYLGYDTITAIDTLERATKAFSGSALISGLNILLDAALGISAVLPPGNFSQGPAKRSWNESCTEAPATVYAPSVFEMPINARVCFPEDIVGLLGNSTEPPGFPVPGSAGSAHFELLGFRLPGSYMTHDWIIAAICIVFPLCFLLWTSITRNKPSTVDDGAILKKSYVDAAIADLSGRIPDLGPLLANQQRLEGQLIQIDGVEGRVNGRTDNRLRELKVSFQRQIRDIDLESLTRSVNKFQKNHDFMASQIRKLQDDQTKKAKDLEYDLTTKLVLETNRVQSNLISHVQNIEGHFGDVENANEKALIEVRQVAKEQASCNSRLGQLQVLEKQVTDCIAQTSTLQRQVDDIDAFNQKFKGTKDGTVSIADKMRKLQQQMNSINTSDERIRALEDEMASTDRHIRTLQKQEVSDIKRVRGLESEIASLTQLVQELKEQSQTEDATKILPDILERLNNCLTITRSQEIQNSLNQKVANVENMLRQIPVVNKEEERAHTQILLENTIQNLDIDELRKKLQTVESEVKEDTQNIINIQTHIGQTESKIENEFARTKKDTEQLVKEVVKEFQISVDEIRKTIDTLDRDFKERAPDKVKVEKVIDDLRIDLKIAEEKVGDLEQAEGTRASVMVQINEIKSQLQELTDKSTYLSQKQEVLAYEQDRLKKETQGSSQSSQPPQTIGASNTPSAANVFAAEFRPSSETPASFSQSTAHSDSSVQAGPSTEVISSQSSQAVIAQTQNSQPQTDNQKGKQRETPLPPESSGTSWADQVNDEQGESDTSETTDEKPRKSQTQNTARPQDPNAVRVSPMEDPERVKRMLWESKKFEEILTEHAKKHGSKGDLTKSMWADPPPDPGPSSSSGSKTLSRRRKGGKSKR